VFHFFARNEHGQGAPSDDLFVSTLPTPSAAPDHGGGGGGGGAARAQAQEPEDGFVSLGGPGELFASPGGLVELPPGWAEYWDPASGLMFYFNKVGQPQPSTSTSSPLLVCYCRRDCFVIVAAALRYGCYEWRWRWCCL
jgi:hypothetical protein